MNDVVWLAREYLSSAVDGLIGVAVVAGTFGVLAALEWWNCHDDDTPRTARNDGPDRTVERSHDGNVA